MNWETFKRSLPANAVLFAVVLIVAYSGIKMLYGGVLLYQESRENQKKIDALRSEKASLESRIREFNRPETIERLAKEKLNLKKAGEEVVVVPPEPVHATTAAAQDSSFWGRVKRTIAQ